MAAPTHDDAVLLVQLSQWGTAMGLQDAIRAILDDDFDTDTADYTDAPVTTILQYGETIGTLVKNDLFSRELAEDWLWCKGLWARVGPAALRGRERLGEPRLFENFEALAGTS
jgi:hypothetical protein